MHVSTKRLFANGNVAKRISRKPLPLSPPAMGPRNGDRPARKVSFAPATLMDSYTASLLDRKRPENSESAPSQPLRDRRIFDEHTVTIYATNMATRGGDPKAAIQFILNRIESRRIAPSTPLFNAAIDICGHQGMLIEAARILHQMIAMNVRPNGRTVSSLLNCIAERARTLPGSKMTKEMERSEPEGLSPSSVNPPGSLPQIDAFEVRNKWEAMKLAIKIFASWTGFIKQPGTNEFNALLKVVWCTHSGFLLPRLFPIKGDVSADNAATGISWLPDVKDKITFTTAIIASKAFSNCLQRAVAYFQMMHVEGHPIDATCLMALFTAFADDSIRRLGVAGAVEERYKLFQVVAPSFKALPVEQMNVRLINSYLDVCRQMGLRGQAISFWNDHLLPMIEASRSVKACKSHIDDRTIALLLAILNKSKRYELTLITERRLRLDFGLHLTSRILVQIIHAHAMINARKITPASPIAADLCGDALSRCIGLFNQFVREAASIEPTRGIILALNDIIRRRDTIQQIPASQRREALFSIFKFLKDKHRSLYDELQQESNLRGAFELMKSEKLYEEKLRNRALNKGIHTEEKVSPTRSAADKILKKSPPSICRHVRRDGRARRESMEEVRGCEEKMVKAEGEKLAIFTRGDSGSIFHKAQSTQAKVNILSMDRRERNAHAALAQKQAYNDGCSIAGAGGKGTDGSDEGPTTRRQEKRADGLRRNVITPKGSHQKYQSPPEAISSARLLTSRKRKASKGSVVDPTLIFK